MARTSDAIEIIKQTFGIDPATDPEILEIAEQYRVAQEVYDARTAAGLTQQELADAIGTSPQVIEQLEDADYEGSALAVLRKIATALDRKLEIRLTPNHREQVASH